jgi:dTDP-glucose 4,6-dehydratase
MQNILVTGGSGFIGTNYIHLLNKKYPDLNIYNLDELDFAISKENHDHLDDRYNFVHTSLLNKQALEELFEQVNFDYVVNFAAKSHVDNSIKTPEIFTTNNIIGTQNLLEQCLKKEPKLFIQISTDEVYGSLSADETSTTEQSQIKPNNPYSASKAGADCLVRSYYKTFGLPVIITRSSNNFGPYQYPEKLIPVVIINALSEKRIPVYGDGKQIRDWIFVDDHNEALMQCLNHAKSGETYNIGSSNQINNIDLIKTICAQLDILKPLSSNRKYFALIDYIKDRPGHDRQYGINNQKAVRDLSWQPKTNFQDAIKYTIQWYIDHQEWWKKIIDKKND